MLLAAAALVAPAPAPAQPAGDPPAQQIAAIDPAELAAVRPLLPRGAVLIDRLNDWGAGSRVTVYLPVHAPAATVLRTISTPEDYPAFMPEMDGVQILSRAGRLTAFRFGLSAAIFRVSVDASLRVVSPQRVDFQILRSELGVGGARWELIPDGPSETVLALTVWSDPARGNWTVRQVAGSGGYGTQSIDIAASTVLALGVKRRAEVLAGARLPARPAAVGARTTDLAPPPPGPWVTGALNGHVMVLSLDPTGALTQVTAVAWTGATPDRLARRMLDPASFHSFWGWMNTGGVLGRWRDSVRFRASIGAPLVPDDGELVSAVERNGAVIRVEGVAGGLLGERHRIDQYTGLPGGGTYVLYTAPPSLARVPPLYRTAIAREPWLAVGITAYWHMVTARLALSNLT